jgi:hypothetical protein
MELEENTATKDRVRHVASSGESVPSKHPKIIHCWLMHGMRLTSVSNPVCSWVVLRRGMLAADPASHLQQLRGRRRGRVEARRCKDEDVAVSSKQRVDHGETDAAGGHGGRGGRAEIRRRIASLQTSRRGRRSRAGKAAIGRQDRRRGCFANKLDRVYT